MPVELLTPNCAACTFVLKCANLEHLVDRMAPMLTDAQLDFLDELQEAFEVRIQPFADA